MTLKKIESARAPAAIGCYSPAIQFGNLIFLSGQIGLDPTTLQLANGVGAQITQIFSNIQALAQEVNADFSHILKLTIFLHSMDDYSLINKVMQQHFKPPYPARSVVQVTALPKNALIEVEAVLGL